MLVFIITSATSMTSGRFRYIFCCFRTTNKLLRTIVTNWTSDNKNISQIPESSICYLLQYLSKANELFIPVNNSSIFRETRQLKYEYRLQTIQGGKQNPSNTFSFTALSTAGAVARRTNTALIHCSTLCSDVTTIGRV